MKNNSNYICNMNSNNICQNNTYNKEPLCKDDISTSTINNPVRIRTINNLFLIERNGLVVQSNTQVDLWIVESTNTLRRIRNINTGMYIGLESRSTENNVRIATLPSQDFLLSEWIFYNIAFYSGQQIVNTFSSKALDVPENSSESGVPLIQFSRKSPFLGVNNQRFFIEEV